jgi:hypothetical protein
MGAKVSEERGFIPISGVSYSRLQSPVHVPLGDYGLAVAWQSFCSVREGHLIYVQRLDGRGAPTGQPIAVNLEPAPAELWVALAPLEDGGFVVYWQERNDPGRQGWGQRFDHTGMRRGRVCSFARLD